jgi:DNA-binding HxlR family transcriptional regulator
MRLSRLDLKDTMAPLVSEGLIRKRISEIPLKADEVLSITPKGEQFIELMELAFQYVDVEKSG